MVDAYMQTAPNTSTMLPIAEGYLLGFLSLSCFVAALFFLKFWRQTRDGLFLAFAVSFAIEGANRLAIVFVQKPNEASPSHYVVRMVAALMILFAILRKNRTGRTTP